MVAINTILYKGVEGEIIAESYELGLMAVESDREIAIKGLEEHLRVLIDSAREFPSTALLYKPSEKLTEGLTRVMREGDKYKPEGYEISEHSITLHVYDLTKEDLSSPRQQLPPKIKREFVEAK